MLRMGAAEERGEKKKLALWMPFQISVCLCSLSPCVSLSSLLDFTYFFPTNWRSLLVSLFSLLLRVVNFFFYFFFFFLRQLSSSHPSSPQGPLYCLWMLLIWTPRGSLARPHSSTPWKAPLSSVSTPAQVCVCAYVCVWGCVRVYSNCTCDDILSSNHQAFRIGVQLRS